MRPSLRCIAALGALACWCVAGPERDTAVRSLWLPQAEAQVAGVCAPGIEFFGHIIEGGAFVWVIDRSCSMARVAPGSTTPSPLEVAKLEVNEAIGRLSPGNRFGVVLFGSSPLSWSSTLQVASPSNISSAIAFVASAQPDGLSCLAVGVVEALLIAGSELMLDPALMLLTDGLANCPGLGQRSQNIVAANVHDLPIHVVAMNGHEPGLEALAAATGGLYILP